MKQVQGLYRLHKKLKALPIVARKMVRERMEVIAEDIVRMMKSLVAKDDGTLRDSIGWTWGKAPKGSMVIASVKARDADMTLTIYAGNAEAYYARWVEFGTSQHVNGGLFKGSVHPGTTAQPYFYVSWRANKKSARRGLRKASRDAAKKVAAMS